MDVRGITGCGGYLPYRRLDLEEVSAVAGGGGRKGQRAVASFDEDATTMAVEAARTALRSAGPVELQSLWFTTVAPPYQDRTNANAIHAALRMARTAAAYDVVGSVRSGFASLRSALASAGPALAVASDLRVGLPGGPDEAYFGDGAGALILADDSDLPVVAEIVAWQSVSDEFLDRWRTPGDERSKVWEERFGEVRYTDAGIEALESAIKQAGIDAGRINRFVVTGTHGRAVKAVASRSGITLDPVVAELAHRSGVTGCAHPYVLLTAVLEQAEPDEIIALVGLADGAEAMVLRTTAAVSGWRPVRPLAGQLAGGAPISYGRYLALAGTSPDRASSPARTGPGLGVGGRADDGVEVRSGGFPRRRRGGQPATCSR